MKTRYEAEDFLDKPAYRWGFNLRKSQEAADKANALLPKIIARKDAEIARLTAENTELKAMLDLHEKGGLCSRS